MIDDKLKTDIELMVAGIFDNKEKQEQIRKTEEALTKTVNAVNELTDALEAKNVEFEETKASLDESVKKSGVLTSELEAARKKITDLETDVSSKIKELEIATTTLDNISKDKVAETRMTEIQAAGVARSDLEMQTKKVREMSDEEFATYKDELVEVKTAIETELAKKADKDKAAADKIAADKAEADKAEADRLEAEKESARIAAESAALNFETASVEDITVKYKQLGKALADSVKVKKD